jgi:ABC-type glycerol-3-phosphate transport system substrate-binding protein
MKRVARTVILLILSLIILSACGSGEPEVFDLDFSVKSEKADLEGVTIKYLRRTGGQAQYNGGEQVLGYEADTILADLAIQRIKDVQNNLNCKLDIVYFENGSLYDSFHMSNVTGDYFCDILCDISDKFRNDMKAGALVGLSELEDFLDYRNEDKWGKRNILEVLCWDDDVYAFVPMMWPTSSVSYSGLTVVNEDLINAVGAEDPRDLYENKQWTWATLRDCLEKYYVQEGSEVKQYGLTVAPWDLGMNYILSNGYRIAEIGPDGNYRSGLHDPRALTAMNEGQDVYNGALSYTIDGSNDPVNSLIAGKTVLGVLHYAEYLIQNIVKEMTNFGLVPWPSGPDVEPGFMATNHHNLERAIAISRFSPNVEATAIALNALYEPFEDYPTNDSIMDFLYRTYFFDRRDAEVYYGLFMNTQYSYFASPPWSSLGGWMENGQTPTEYIESNIDKIEEYIKREIAPSKRGAERSSGNG